MKYAPRKVYIKESGTYVELSYTDFCRRKESDQRYMDKLFIPVQGCLLEVVREQYADFYKDKERWRYLEKLDTKNGLLSLDGFTDSEGNVIDFIVDEAVDVTESAVHNVRYIAVNDGVDTLNKSAMDITPFRNILNEMYSADVSVKIKSAYRARFQQGKFMGTYAPYGYIKDPADHNHLLIDDKVAHVVREIFDLALAGNGISKIRKHINKQHILRPAAYAAEQGATGYERYFEGNEENRYIWSENSVRGILRSPIYAGNLAGYKRIATNMKSKKRPSKLPEEWEVIPDTHEGIVTQEEFDTVQQLITSRRLPENKGGFENIFAGVIKCVDCGYALRAMSANRRKRPDIIDCVQYTCNNYGRYGNVMCTAHAIEARDLFNAVLADINRFADMAVNDERAVRAIEKRLTETDQSKAKAMEKEQKKLNKRLAELDRLFASLYEDKVMERITERNFEMMSGKYQKEQLEIEARLKEVTETLNESYEKSQGIRDFLSLIRNYQGLKELDATVINALIDKILVSEREKSADGTVKQEIKIYYKFIGFVGELHITPTKRWTALLPKNCTVCDVEYVPGSGISKYCPICAKKMIDASPVSFVPVDDLELPAFYDSAQQTIFIKTGLNEEQLFVSMAKEVSAAVFDCKHKESRDASEFKSFCVAYMVSSRYGVDTKGFNFSNLPKEFAGMETQEFKGQLGSMRDVLGEIQSDMYKSLEKNKPPKSKEQER